MKLRCRYCGCTDVRHRRRPKIREVYAGPTAIEPAERIDGYEDVWECYGCHEEFECAPKATRARPIRRTRRFQSS